MVIVIPAEPTVLNPIALQFLLDAALVLAVELFLRHTTPCNRCGHVSYRLIAASRGRMTVNEKLEETWKEAAVACFKLLSQCFC
jgi:hypothetical protein